MLLFSRTGCVLLRNISKFVFSWVSNRILWCPGTGYTPAEESKNANLAIGLGMAAMIVGGTLRSPPTCAI